MSASPPTLPLMAHAAASARLEARSDLLRRSPDRAVIDAALDVNEAAGLDDALGILVRVGRELLGADRVSVAVWDEAHRQGTVRAADGVGANVVGDAIRPAPDGPYRAVLSGRPVVTRSISTDGLDPRLAPSSPASRHGHRSLHCGGHSPRHLPGRVEGRPKRRAARGRDRAPRRARRADARRRTGPSASASTGANGLASRPSSTPSRTASSSGRPRASS